MKADSRIALVDGNRSFHHVMRNILRALEYRGIDCFAGGRDAKGYMVQSRVDLAFIDLYLADGNGVDLIHDLRHTRLTNPDMPIILLTSFTSKRTIEEAMSAGADYVLAKPLSPKRVAERIPSLMMGTGAYIRTASGYYGPDPELRRRRRAGPGENHFAAFGPNVDRFPEPGAVYSRPEFSGVTDPGNGFMFLD